MLISIQSIDATSTEPTGKNILDPSDATYHDTGFYVSSVTVKPSTTYVFSMPSNYFVGEITLKIESREGMLIETLNDDSGGCGEVDYRFYCAFTTSDTTTEIQINGAASSPDMKRHFDWVGSMELQIEEGDTYTGYEPYTVDDETAPVIQGDGLLVTSYETILTIDTIIDNYITAYDDIDGDVTDNIYIIDDAYSNYEQDVGDYDVTLGVHDSSQNTTEFTLTIRVKDEIAPIIQGPSYLAVDVNNPPSIDTLITDHFSLEDDYDGNISTYTILDDTYTANTTVLGEKNVTFSIEDQSGNQTTHTLTIDIQDTEAPVITAPEAIGLVLSESYTADDLLSDITAADNHTDPANIALSIDNHTMPSGFDTPGDYEITYKAVDASLNESYVTVPVTITDDIKPNLSGPETIDTSYLDPLSLTDIKAMLTVTDNYKTLTTDDITVLSNDYHNVDNHTPGIYQIVFHVSDTENIDTHTLYIHVVDDVAPTFSFDDRIMIENGSTLSNDDMLLILLKDADIKSFNPIDLRITDTVKEDNLTYYTVLLTNENQETVERIIPVETLKPASSDQTSWVTPQRIILSFTALTLGIIFIKRFKR